MNLTTIKPLQINNCKIRINNEHNLNSLLPAMWILALSKHPSFNRGKQYAQAGRILSINITDGKLVSNIRGNNYSLYSVQINFHPLTHKHRGDIEKLIYHLANNKIALKELAENTIDTEICRLIEASLNVSVEPISEEKLSCYCSCPHQANYCKHIIAVLYILSYQLAIDPFLIFDFIGIPKEIILKIKNPNDAKKIVEEASYFDDFWSYNHTSIKKMNTKVSPPEINGAAALAQGKLPFRISKKISDSFFWNVYKIISNESLKKLKKSS